MKSLKSMHWLLFLVVGIAVMMQSCKPSIPSQYLSKGEMEDILYDYHLAEAMARSGNPDDMLTYREAILKKHEVTSAQFDSSMLYYMRHTELLGDIYDKLQKRMEDEAKSLGADVNSINRFGENVAQGDTANVWNDATSLVFSATKPFNYHSFEIPVDSGFHKGDKLMLDFDAQFIFQDGMRDGIALLAVTFQNDSVASTSVHIQGSQHYSLQIEDHDSLGIKSIKGYFLLSSGNYNYEGGSESTLKLMFLMNIDLIRMHVHNNAASVQPDTTGIHKKDSVQPAMAAPAPTDEDGNTTSHEMKAEPLPLPPRAGKGPIKPMRLTK